MNKLLVILGPTATGKTELALKLAQKLNGEVISADSRQVYKGMDVGTGKEISNIKYQKSKIQIKNKEFNVYILKEIKCWMWDVINPDEDFSVADYCQLAWNVIEHIWKRGKLPIIVGGTGLYIKALVDGIGTFGIPRNDKLRKALSDKDVLYLQNKLTKIDSKRFNIMNNSDRNNPRRLIRAIEIALQIQNSKVKSQNHNSKLKIDALMIGLTCDREILNKRIDQRVEGRVRQGIIEEIKSLLSKGYSWDLPAMSGLGYRQWRGYFEKRETKEAVVEKWKIAEHQYAKNQMTWFKKDKRIVWYDISNYGK